MKKFYSDPKEMENDLEEIRKENLKNLREIDQELNVIKKSNRKLVFIIIVIVVGLYIVGAFLSTDRHFDSEYDYQPKAIKNFVLDCIDNNYINLDTGHELTIEMEDMYLGMCDSTEWYIREGKQCFGYITVKNKDGNYSIDTSHYCDY